MNFALLTLPTTVEKQRNNWKYIVTTNSTLFSSRFKTGTMKVPPIEIDLNQPLIYIKPYC